MPRIGMHFALSIALAALMSPFGALQASADGPTITGVVVTQVLGKQEGRFVAGKDAVIRVLLSAEVLADAATQSVVIKRGGTAVTTLKPSTSPTPTRSLVFVCPTQADCGGWKAGDYTFDVTVGASKSSATAKLQDRIAMNVLAVPVKANYGPGDVRTVDATWKQLGDFTRRTYPIAPENFKWSTGPEIDLSADKYDLKTDDGMYEVWRALAELVPAECRQSPKPAGITCYDKVVGFVRSAQGAAGNIAGYTMGSPANVVTATDQDAAATVAHEIAHIYKVSDEYGSGQMGTFWCYNNAPPAGFIGRNGDTGDTAYRCADSKEVQFPGVDGVISYAAEEMPYEIGGRGDLPDFTSFMGTGAFMHQQWISWEIWKTLFDALAPTAVTQSVDAQAATRFVSVLGSVDNADEVQLFPWGTFTAATTHTSTTGTYQARALDAAGKVLATTKLDVFFEQLAPGMLAPEAGFDAVLPFTADTAKFEILKGTKVLKTVTPSRTAPTVTITAPVSNESVKDGEYTVKWAAADADGDKLTYMVEYSIDGKEWLPLIGDIAETEWVDDFSFLAGTGKAESRIRVTATDGVHSTTATSGLFTVSGKAPLVDIEFPFPFDEFSAGSEVYLVGGALDLKDDTITNDDGLVWTSSIQGQLGKGELLSLSNMKVGEHVLTLTATNSVGLKSSASITVTVHPGGRRVVLADVYAVYGLYLGREPVYGIETPGWLGVDFGQFVEEVRWSDEALTLEDSGYIPAKSPYTGQTIRR